MTRILGFLKVKTAKTKILSLALLVTILQKLKNLNLGESKNCDNKKPLTSGGCYAYFNREIQSCRIFSLQLSAYGNEYIRMASKLSAYKSPIARRFVIRELYLMNGLIWTYNTNSNRTKQVN